MRGILAAWAMGAASRVRPEVISPRMTTTLSREISFLTTVADSPGFDWSSSVMSSRVRPRTPPAALDSSMARRVPLLTFWPKTASLPVIEANSPSLMVSGFRSQPDEVSRAVVVTRTLAMSWMNGREAEIIEWQRGRTCAETRRGLAGFQPICFACGHRTDERDVGRGSGGIRWGGVFYELGFPPGDTRPLIASIEHL